MPRPFFKAGAKTAFDGSMVDEIPLTEVFLGRNQNGDFLDGTTHGGEILDILSFDLDFWTSHGAVCAPI
jgi:hypothetical protein